MKAQNPEGVLLYTVFIVFLKDGLVLLVAFQSRPHSASQRTSPVPSQASAVTPARSSDKTLPASVPVKLEPGSNLRPGSGVRQRHLMLFVFFLFIYLFSDFPEHLLWARCCAWWPGGGCEESRCDSVPWSVQSCVSVSEPPLSLL